MPEDERNALLSSIALSRLGSDEVIPVAERRQLVLDVVADVDQITSRPDDPRKLEAQAQLLLTQARLLIDQGVNEEVRLLEYFGDNPDRRRYVRQVAEAVTRMLATSAEFYDEVADRYENLINSVTDPAVKKAQAARAAANQSRDGGVFADYYRVLSMDPDDPDRINLAEEILSKVGRADRPDNPRQSFVQLYLGKVALARGNEQGLQAARDYFTKVLSTAVDENERFDAYFFLAVVEAKARDITAAEAKLGELKSWFAGQDMLTRVPLVKVLEFRVADAASRYASTAAEQDVAADRARAALVELANDYEGYRAVVTDQLLTRIDESVDLATLTPLMLDALVDQGRAEAAKLAGDEAELADRTAIDRGIAAAREIVNRSRGGENLPADLVARNAFLLGLMLQLTDRPAEAAETFIAYGDLPGADETQKRSAFRRALGIVEELKRTGDEAARIGADEIEAQLLPVLVEELGDTARAFDLANRQHRTGNLDEAIKYYDLVPDDDPRKTDAVYLQFLAETQKIAEMDPQSQTRARLVAQLPRKGETALAALRQSFETAIGPAKDAFRERLVRIQVSLASFLLSERDEPDQALALLQNIEDDARGLPAAEAILGEALPLRFRATAATGDIDAATSDLLALLDRSDAERGLAFIAQFRETLNREFRSAVVRNDAADQRDVMQTRAAVTPKLVAWIDASDDPEYRKYAYNFRRFNAETQLQAAMLIVDEAERAAQLRRALDAYEDLATPANVQLYQQLLPGDLTEQQRAQILYDREVVF
ncbi:MAG: hypothetical protein AAGK78_04170, partial [Planctomycetota bacterium]